MSFTVISVLIESRRLLIWVKSKVVALRSIAHYCTQSVLSSGYIQRLTAYELNGLSI